MLSNHFYNRILRKYVIAFGNMFNNITLVRYNKAGDVEIDRMIVPITYAPKEKYINKIKNDPDFNRMVQTILPRMSYEITDIKYDSNRKLQTTIKNTFINSSGVYVSSYAPIPYDISFNLYILVRNIEDGNQIVEQILPFFTPQYNLKLNLVPSANITKDIPILLNTVDQNIDYDGEYESTRNIIWTLSFTLKGYFFGPIIDNNSSNNIIRKVTVDVFDNSVKMFNDKLVINLGPGTGSFMADDYVYQGTDQYNTTAFGKIIDYIPLTRKLIVENIQGVFDKNEHVKGINSTGNYQITSFNFDESRKVATITVTPNPPYANADWSYGYDEVIVEWPKTT